MKKDFITDFYPTDLLKVTVGHKRILYRIAKYCILRMNSSFNAVEKLKE